MVFKPSYREEVIMALTPEAKVKAQVVKLLRRYNAYYFFPAANGYGRAGIPDIISCVNGKFIAIECKAGSNTTTGLQKKELDEIQQAKGVAAVINETNIDLVEQILKEHTQ